MGEATKSWAGVLPMSPPIDSGPLTDSKLLRSVRDLRDGDSWREFIDIYGPYLVGVLTRRGIPHQDVLDLVQETFIVVMDHIGDFEYDHSKRFRGWLATIALRKAWRLLGGLRPVGGTTNLMVLGNLDGGDTDWEGMESRLQVVLQRTRTIVSPLEWRAFQMTVLENMENKAASQALGIEIGHLYVCKSRVKSVLEKVLEETDE
jgi:RNA polymerase sigma-70 factor (ECF subfamily)